VADLPIVVEIVDTPAKVEEFIPVLDAAITEGLLTVEAVDVRLYRAGE